MSQQQPERPQTFEAQDVPVVEDLKAQPIYPHDVSPMLKDLSAAQPIYPEDATVTQTTETVVYVAETDVSGTRVVTGFVVRQVTPASEEEAGDTGGETESEAITIGEALEVSAVSAGDKPVERSDADAIQAAEAKVSGLNAVIPGGIAAEAQAAADANSRVTRDEDKTSLADVLTDATTKLLGDKAATREDAETVVGAEIRNNPEMATHPGGVAASLVTAARLNQERQL